MKRSKLAAVLVALFAWFAAGCDHGEPRGVGAVHGQVAMTGGGSLDGIALTLVGPTVRAAAAAADGTFTFGELPSGAYTLFVDATATRPTQLRRDVVVSEGSDTMIDGLSFDPIAIVVGKILVDGASTHVGTTVTAADGSVTTTEDDGAFSLAVGLATKTVIATRAGSQPLVLATDSLDRGAARDVGTHTLLPGESVTYALLGEARIAGSTDRAAIEVAIDALGVTTMTDASGKFAFSNLPGGAHTLRITRGAFHDEVPNVLLGLGGAKVLSSQIIYELGAIELAAGKRVARQVENVRPGLSNGRYVLARGGANGEDQVEVWDTMTDTPTMTVPVRQARLTARETVFDGDAVLLASGPSINGGRLSRVDLLTHTTTELASGFTGVVHFPTERVSLLTRTQGIATVELLPWSGATGVVVEHVAGTIAGRHSFVTLSNDAATPTTWRRVSDGAVLQSTSEPVQWNVRFSADDERVVLAVGDHLEAWSEASVVKSPPIACPSSLTLVGDVLWCNRWGETEALRLADLTRIGSDPLMGTSVSPSDDGRDVLTTQATNDNSHLMVKRGHREGNDAFVFEDLGLFTPAMITPVANGWWAVGAETKFIPKQGAITLARTELLLDPQVASDGTLLYRDANSASTSALHRLTSAGVDTVLANNVITYATITGDDFLVSAVVGDRIEQMIVRTTTGETIPLGIDSGAGTVAISATDYYQARRDGTHLQGYRDGMFRLHFANGN